MDIDKSVRKRKDRKKSIEVNELGEKFLKEPPELASRELVDGTVTETNIEPSTLLTAGSAKSSQNSPKGFYLKFEIDIVFLLLLGLALWTRTYNLEEPHYIVFDELHYGRYVSLYTKGIFFFDAHPPLGKQLLYLAGQLGGYNGNFTFDRIGSPYTDSVPIRALRMIPAISGSLLVGITYQLMLEISTYQWTAILAALLVLFVGRQMWQRIGYTESTLRLALSIIWRSFVLVTLPLIVYIGVFYAHLAMLPKAGPHDSVMTSAFQASLQGGLASITKGQPLHVSHGSQITLRHSHGRTCWLHSHAHVYPVRYTDGRGSSHQQQVTCYSFKDVNNWWIVKRPEQASLAVTNPPDAIRHGDVVQLLHGITSRALNSHDVAAPVSPQSQEVSCYIDYNVSMPAQNLWRVEIVNRDNEEATWDSIRSLVRLIHVDSGSALRFSGRQLPSWGFHQHEVVADKVVTHQDTIWNVEEHRYTKAEDRRERERELVSAEMIPTAVTQLSFWAKFMELQYKMIAHAPDAPSGHMFASEPTEWPLLSRSIAYWLSPHSNAQIHLIGNIVTWYAGTLSVLLYSAFLAFYAIRQRRMCEDLPLQASHQFYNAGCILFLGYWLHYLPYFFVDRTLFLHHYLPAYMFKILLLAYVIDHLYLVLQLREKTRVFTNVLIIGITVWLSYVLLTFIKFSVLSYGNTDLNENDLMNLRWKDTWDFILHKRG
ncbi:Protein O-mannosyltransferase 1 [Papilio machaon]|uniref:Protein O-mannosyltransferase 1 n=1 Tax=Papilio machaon TaxID=76193 RepID=A0A0N0PC21_PAPMA|nr:Protein O-mannosyltransferase 1 [Papilio machaon]